MTWDTEFCGTGGSGGVPPYCLNDPEPPLLPKSGTGGNASGVSTSAVSASGTEDLRYYETPRSFAIDSVISGTAKAFFYNDDDPSYDADHRLMARHSRPYLRTYQKVQIGYTWEADAIDSTTPEPYTLLQKHGYSADSLRIWTDPFGLCWDSGGCPGGTADDRSDRTIQYLQYANRNCSANPMLGDDLESGSGQWDSGSSLWKLCTVTDRDGNATTAWSMVPGCGGHYYTGSAIDEV